MSIGDIIQIVIAVLTLIATISVSIAIYWLQKHHEKESYEQRNEDNVGFFLIENEKEICFLPLCVMANCIHPYKMHKRNIYNVFNKCRPEVQKLILENQKIPLNLLKNKEWLSKCFSKFKKDAQKYNLGENLWHDIEKYFYRSINYFEFKIEDSDPSCFDVAQLNVPKTIRTAFFDKTISFLEYIDFYIEQLLLKSSDFEKMVKPFSLVWDTQNLANCEEKSFCYWVMLMIRDTCYALYFNGINKDALPVTNDIPIETFEDSYYYTALSLFLTYECAIPKGLSKDNSFKK